MLNGDGSVPIGDGVGEGGAAVVLIACCGSKLDHAAPAGEIYRSMLFMKSWRYALQRVPVDRIRILSALHGVLEPDRVIEPYDVTLNAMSPVDRRHWGQAVLAQLAEQGWASRYIILAGSRYREWVDQAPSGVEIEIPMRGMGIGHQLSFLTRRADQSIQSLEPFG